MHASRMSELVICEDNTSCRTKYFWPIACSEYLKKVSLVTNGNSSDINSIFCYRNMIFIAKFLY
jgi:hypothetical protein